MAYYEGVKAIFKFAREILNMSSRVCMADINSGTVTDLVEFRDLRNRIFEKHQVTVQNCTDAQRLGLPILASLGRTWAADPTAKLIDRGTEITGFELDLDPNAAASAAKRTSHNGGYWDLRFSSGVSSLKSMALLSLASRGAEFTSSLGQPVLRTTDAAGVRAINFLDFPWFSEALVDDAVARVSTGLERQYIDPALTGRVSFFREYEDFNYALLRGLMNAGLDQRSASYQLSLSMRPSKEASLTTFSSRYGTSEEPLWYVTNTSSQVLYSTSTTAAGRLLRVLCEALQMPAVGNTVGHLGTPAALTQIEARLVAASTSLSNEDRFFQVSLQYFTLNRLSLQPAQKGMLRSALRTAIAGATPSQLDSTGQTAFLVSTLDQFVKTSLVNPMVLDLATTSSENYTALVNTLNQYILSF